MRKCEPRLLLGPVPALASAELDSQILVASTFATKLRA